MVLDSCLFKDYRYKEWDLRFKICNFDLRMQILGQNLNKDTTVNRPDQGLGAAALSHGLAPALLLSHNPSSS